MDESTRFIDRFTTILLDMNSTFMFGEDRFGDDEDFYATYRALGGGRLDAAAVTSAIRNCYDGMSRDYDNPEKFDCFPTLAEGLRVYGHVDETEVPLLAAVFARHELGRVPDEYADCLKRLAGTHQLVVVSNIWAPKNLWLAEFERAGVGDLFKTVVFSSDGRSIKPSPRMFQQALAYCDTPLSRTVFVGDSLRVDVEPAKALGLNTVWIADTGETHPLVDCIVPSLLYLEQWPA